MSVDPLELFLHQKLNVSEHEPHGDHLLRNWVGCGAAGLAMRHLWWRRELGQNMSHMVFTPFLLVAAAVITHPKSPRRQEAGIMCSASCAVRGTCLPLIRIRTALSVRNG